jgi:hypothetical protein
MAANTSRIIIKHKRISQPASPRMALNTQRPALNPTTSRSVSRMALSIFMMQKASTSNGTGTMRMISTIQTNTSTITREIRATATGVPIGHQIHHNSIIASNSTP